MKALRSRINSRTCGNEVGGTSRQYKQPCNPGSVMTLTKPYCFIFQSGKAAHDDLQKIVEVRVWYELTLDIGHVKGKGRRASAAVQQFLGLWERNAFGITSGTWSR